MTNIVHTDPVQLAGTNSSAAEDKAQSRNKLLIVLLVLFVLALLATVAIGAFSLLVTLYPSRSEAVSLIDWPYALQTRNALLIGLALLTILLYLAARWQITHDKSLQSAAGCPSCRQPELMHIRRTKRDRFLTLSGVRVARYQCRDCLWNGRRVYRKTHHPFHIATISSVLNIDTVAHPQAASTLDPQQQSVQPPAQAADNSLDLAEGHKPETTTIPFVSTVRDRLDAGTAALSDARTNSKPVAKPTQPAALPFENAADSKANGAVPAKTRLINTEPDEKAPAPMISPENERPIAEKEDASHQDLELISCSKAKIATTFGVNLKAKPHSDANWVGLLGPDTVVSLIQNQKQEDGTLWCYVSAGQQNGWVACSCLKAFE